MFEALEAQAEIIHQYSNYARLSQKYEFSCSRKCSADYPQQHIERQEFDKKYVLKFRYTP